MSVEIIKKGALEEALGKKYRVYLAGKLKRPQPELVHIQDEIEVGVSYYQAFTADTPHLHPIATEHAYVLEGCLRVKLLENGEEYEVKKGDFFVLRPNTAYATKNQAGTKILFVKSPEGNDKQVVEVDEEIKKWLSAWDA